MTRILEVEEDGTLTLSADLLENAPLREGEAEAAVCGQEETSYPKNPGTHPRKRRTPRQRPRPSRTEFGPTPLRAQQGRNHVSPSGQAGRFGLSWSAYRAAPPKKPKGGERTEPQKAQNRQFAAQRVR